MIWVLKGLVFTTTTLTREDRSGQSSLPGKIPADALCHGSFPCRVVPVWLTCGAGQMLTALGPVIALISQCRSPEITNPDGKP